MTGRILIVDTVPTNRVVLKAKMLAAHFSVETCSTIADAIKRIAAAAPDLVMINLSDPVEDRHNFCKSLRNQPETASIGIVAVGVADTAMARFAALDAGADDVLPLPVNDVLLVARIRSLLRAHSSGADIGLHHAVGRALGFEEAGTPFASSSRVAVVSDAPATAEALISDLRIALQQKIAYVPLGTSMTDVPITPTPDLMIITTGADEVARGRYFGAISDLRTRPDTRATAQLVIVPRNQPEVAATFLDLGADDVVSEDCDTRELVLRAKALLRRKHQCDRVSASLRSGLYAAMTDPLTGLYNRRYATARLEHLAEEAALSGQSFAVMMVDIDHFNTINDKHGHLVGDQVLRQLANCLRKNLRAIDLVARIGGEEFLVALPQTTEAQAEQAADRLRNLIGQTAFVTGHAGARLDVTVSIGVVVETPQRADHPTVADLCSTADQALFQAKMAGRNRVAMGRSAA